jgi:hypothetical protein
MIINTWKISEKIEDKEESGIYPLHRAMAVYCPLSSSGVTTTLIVRLLPSAVCFGE